jgi:hypothetical protein
MLEDGRIYGPSLVQLRHLRQFSPGPTYHPVRGSQLPEYQGRAPSKMRFSGATD